MIQIIAGLLLALVILTPAYADTLDDYINGQMQQHHVVGLSLAIMQEGMIIKAKGYGTTEKDGTSPVTPDTLFQAGSISKAVAALGALRLVEQGKLSLDEDVNAKLTTWKVPVNTFTGLEKVTLRRILCHSAGLTVHGFPGYAVGQTVPTLVQVLNGTPPANTLPIRVDTIPGRLWRYSGGGYEVMQQLVQDVTGQPFPDFMQTTVLTPLGMTQSTYVQPLPDDMAANAATGYYQDGSAVKGRWHVYPEMAAAGLWTTASDLARFALGIQKSLDGVSNPVISQAMTRQMLTEQKNKDGLGVMLAGNGPTLHFSHDGRNEGFDGLLTAYAHTGQGAVILINGNEDSGMVARIMQEIAKQYQWPAYPIPDVTVNQ